MKMKMKMLVVLACAVVIVASSVMGTLAYLTDEAEAVNTFTIGKVAIKLDEAKVNPDGTPVAGADRVTANEYHLIPGGTYTVQIGASSRDIRLEQVIEISGEEIAVPAWQFGSWYDAMNGQPSREEWEKLMGYPVSIISEPKKGQFTMDSTCMEMKDHSFVMKIQYMVTENIVAKGFGGKKDLSDPSYKMMLTCATDCPMRSVVISSGGMMSESVAQGMLHMANGHYIKGLAAMLKK